jgi:hypothetical protein
MNGPYNLLKVGNATDLSDDEFYRKPLSDQLVFCNRYGVEVLPNGDVNTVCGSNRMRCKLGNVYKTEFKELLAMQRTPRFFVQEGTDINLADLCPNMNSHCAHKKWRDPYYIEICHNGTLKKETQLKVEAIAKYMNEVVLEDIKNDPSYTTMLELKRDRND